MESEQSDHAKDVWQNARECLNFTFDCEEKFWRQRAKVKWFQEVRGTLKFIMLYIDN